MKQHFQRVLWVAAPVLFGVAIGWLWSEAHHSSWSSAVADEPSHGAAHKAGKQADAKPVKRVGSVVGVNRETLDQYVLLHKYVWPQVLERIRASNMRNYSIYLGELNDGELYLFSYFEYVGDDFEADMAKMAADPKTQEWWAIMRPLQQPLESRAEGEWWAEMQEVFHTD